MADETDSAIRVLNHPTVKIYFIAELKHNFKKII